jgi:hypothetical protein
MNVAGFAEPYSKVDLKRAMNELFAEDEIVASVELWRGADRKRVVGIARLAAPGAGASPSS